MEELRTIFQSVLEQEFRDVEITKIEIQEAFDSEHDDILYVTVVFHSTGRLDIKAKAGFVRHVRPKLREVQESRFPVMSFVSDEDYRSNLADSCSNCPSCERLGY